MMCGALLAPGARYALRTPHDSDRGAAAPKQAGAQRAQRAQKRDGAQRAARLWRFGARCALSGVLAASLFVVRE